MDSAVVQETLANVISAATILSCLFLKVPQIMSIRAKKSSEGIYVIALLLEVIGFSIMTLYNYTNQYSIMTYLEYPVILLQVYVLLYYVLYYQRRLSAPIVPLGTLLYFGILLGFVYPVLPKEILSYLVPLCTPLSGSAKLTYIYGIIKAANADSVSRTTWIISVLTNISRLFTIYVDSADKKLMFNFTVSSILSACVLITAVYYQTSKPKGVQKRRKSSDSHCHCHKD